MNATNLTSYSIYTDGGSRGNPGPAAYGFVVYDPVGKILSEDKQYIGVTTNNQAEYQGIAAALRYLAASPLPVDAQVTCFLDSQLIVRQINGVYKMKSDELRPWLEQVRQLVKQISIPISFVDVRREQNKYADKLVNQALDEVNHAA